MKRQTLFLIVLTLLVSICGIASAITEDGFLWTNMNNDPVKSGAPNVVDLFMDEEEPIQLERITTYHWNNGEGAEPGTVSIYLGDALLSSWPAVGRSAYGTENAYWDAAVNIIRDGHQPGPQGALRLVLPRAHQLRNRIFRGSGGFFLRPVGIFLQRLIHDPRLLSSDRKAQ